MRRMGIDPGQRRTGLAICDEGVSVAVPMRTVDHTSLQQAVDAVAGAILEAEVGEVVVGLPLRMDGSEGQAAKRVRRFVAALQARVQAPIVLWDERLSTVEAERALSQQGVVGRDRRRVVDQAAATIVLQSYLDAQAEPCQVDPTDDASMPTPAPSPDPQPDQGRGRRGRRRGRRGQRGSR